MGGEVGLNESSVLAYLRSDEDKAEVMREGLSWSGIGGVPYFFINGRPMFSGCQDPSTFAKAILQATSDPCPGDRVLINGLSQATDLNGKHGIVDSFDGKSGRFNVRFEGDKVKAIKPRCLTVVAH